MKRVLGLFVALSLIGFALIESAHYHAIAKTDSATCQVCALRAQAARHLPTASPVPVPVYTWIAVPHLSLPTASLAVRPFAFARAPPFLP